MVNLEYKCFKNSGIIHASHNLFKTEDSTSAPNFIRIECTKTRCVCSAPPLFVLCRKLCVFLILHAAGHHHKRHTRRRNRHTKPQENHRFNHRHLYSRPFALFCSLLVTQDTARCCARSRACRRPPLPRAHPPAWRTPSSASRP